MLRIYINAIIFTLTFQVAGNSYAQQGPNVVALFGDSISSGFNAAFPFRDFGQARLAFGQPSIMLTDILNESGRASIVPNLGWGGTASGPSFDPNLANTSNGLDRINTHLTQVKNAYAGKSYYVLIMYGTNDAAYDIPASVTAYNNGVMIDRANARGFIAVVSTIAPCDVCANNVDDINNRIETTVNSKINAGANAHFVDNHAVLRGNWNSLSDPDGVHPNNTGYSVIANNWFNSKLKGLISRDQVTITPIISLLLDDD
jgi:lysophospholipase L1-like esterase